MEKITSALMIAVCIGMTMPAQAQPIKFGVEGGVNLAKAGSNKSDLKTDNSISFFIGLMVEVIIPPVGLGVDGTPLFSQRGVKVGDKLIRQNGLGIPINLKYIIGLSSALGTHMTAGPDFYLNFLGDKNYEDLGRLDKKNAQIGINVGVGVKSLRHLQIEVNYNTPLSKTAEWKEAGFSYKTKMWQTSTACIFREIKII